VWGEQLDADSARDVLAQPLRPLRPKVWVVLTPEEQRGVIEATRAGQELECDSRVSRIELSCEEPTRLVSAVRVTQIGADVAMQQFGRKHLGVMDCMCLEQRQSERRCDRHRRQWQRFGGLGP
jgi:hypothetical protein